MHLLLLKQQHCRYMHQIFLVATMVYIFTFLHFYIDTFLVATMVYAAKQRPLVACKDSQVDLKRGQGVV